MLLVALLFFAIVAVVGGDVFLENRSLVDISAFGRTFTLAVGDAVAIAAAGGVVLVVALSLAVTAGRRRRHQRREHEAALRDRDNLLARLERERARTRHHDDDAEARGERAEGSERRDDPGDARRVVDVRDRTSRVDGAPASTGSRLEGGGGERAGEPREPAARAGTMP